MPHVVGVVSELRIKRLTEVLADVETTVRLGANPDKSVSFGGGIFDESIIGAVESGEPIGVDHASARAVAAVSPGVISAGEHPSVTRVFVAQTVSSMPARIEEYPRDAVAA